jgi:ADP-ribose pyrophosphatase
MTGTGDGPLSDADTPDDVEIAWSETAYRGYFRIHRYRLRHRMHEGGWTGWMTRELFERGHVVAVLLYDPHADAVVLLHQFRIGALAGGKAGWQTEIVAGVIEPGEQPEAVARREAIEESGVPVERLEPIHHYLVSPGGTTETVRLYCALVDSRQAGGIHGLDHEHEDIRVEARPWSETWALLQDGTIDNAPAIIALQWLALNRERLRAAAR